MKGFINFKTVSNRLIQVRFNHNKRVATIKTEATKFKTYIQSKKEWKSMQHMTGNDWQHFLNNSFDYYVDK